MSKAPLGSRAPTGRQLSSLIGGWVSMQQKIILHRAQGAALCPYKGVAQCVAERMPVSEEQEAPSLYTVCSSPVLAQQKGQPSRIGLSA